MKSSLKSDTALYGAAVLAERFLGLLLLPVLTRQLSPVEYGIWAQTVVASSVLMPIVVLCMPAAIVKFFSADVGGAERRRWMLRVFAMASAVFLVIGAAAWLAQDAVAGAVYGEAAQSSFVQVLVILLAADAMLDLLIAFLRSGFRMRWIAGLMLVRGGLRFGFMLLGLAVLEWPFHRTFITLAMLQLAAATLVLLRELLRKSTGAAAAVTAPQAPTWRRMVAFAMPLLLVSVLTSINGFADRFVLTQLLGLDTLAVYAAVSSLVSITGVAYTVLGFTLFPMLARQWADGNRQGAEHLAGETVKVFLFLAMPYALWLAGSIGTLLPLVTTHAYHVGAEVPLLMGLAALGMGLYQIMLYLLLLADRGLHAAGMMLAAALLNLLLNFVMVPSLGLLGAALAAALSNAVLAAMAYVAARAEFPWRSALRVAVSASLGGAMAWLLARSFPGEQAWRGIVLSMLLAAALCAGIDLAGRTSVLRSLLRRPAAMP